MGKPLVRKRIVEMARRLQSPGAGSSASVLRERTARRWWPDLTTVLRDVEWAAAGAVATRLYMPERSTRDFDIVVRSADAAAVRRRLSDCGYAYHGELGIGGSTWLSPDRTPVDVIEMDEPWLDDAIARAQQNRDPQGFPVLPLEYQVLMKLRAGRVQDLADVARMLGQADQEALVAVRSLFQRLSPDESDDLESLIELGRRELGPPHAP